MPESISPNLLRSEAHRLGDSMTGRDPMDVAGEASFVLLGEASHRTREFYRACAETRLAD
jgi:erythromycin esterase-like protein